VEGLPPLIVTEGDRRVPLGLGIAAEFHELVEGGRDRQSLLIEQRLVVIHADEIDLKRHAVQGPVDRCPLKRRRGDFLSPSVLRRVVGQWFEQSGVGENASIPGSSIVEDHVGPGAGRNRRVDDIAHLVGAEGFARDGDVRVRVHERFVDGVGVVRHSGIGELVPHAQLDFVLSMSNAQERTGGEAEKNGQHRQRGKPGAKSGRHPFLLS